MSDSAHARHSLVPLRKLAVRDAEPISRGATTERRTSAKLIRFSPDELRIVVDRARAAGRPVACYVRESSLGACPRVRKTELSDSLIHILAQLGNRLTELSRVAKAHGLGRADDFERAVGELLDVIRHLD